MAEKQNSASLNLSSRTFYRCQMTFSEFYNRVPCSNITHRHCQSTTPLLHIAFFVVSVPFLVVIRILVNQCVLSENLDEIILKCRCYFGYKALVTKNLYLQVVAWIKDVARQII